MGDLITSSKISHFYCPRPLLLDRAIGNDGGDGVVAVDGGRWMWMDNFLEDKETNTPFLHVEEEGARQT